MRASRAWLLAALLAASSAAAVTQGQQDDFTSSADGWARGDAVLGGPGGASDGYLEVTSLGGSGQNSRLVTFNQLQWAGDYLDAGVESIGVFLDNRGATALQIQLAFGDMIAPIVGGTWYATNPVALPAGSGWTFVVFPIGSGDLQRVQGTATYDDLMANVVTLRLLHGDVPQAMGDPIVAKLGIDQIVAMPEPGANALLASGIAALVACARRRGRA